MIRFLFHFVGLLSAVIILAGASAHASEAVKLRSGEHDGYSRVVFEWDKNTAYEATQEGGRFVVEFAKGGEPSLKELSANYVSGMNILSSDPLRVAFSMPAGTAPRHFSVGKRLVVDFYAPPGAKRAAAPASIPAAAAKPEPAPKKPAPQTPATTALTKPAAPQEPKAPMAVPPPEVVKANQSGADNAAIIKDALQGEEQVKIDEALPILRPSQIKPHMIRMTGTEALGLTVLQYASSLWIMLDKTNLPIRPQIDGPNAEAFQPVEDIAQEGAVLFRMNMPPDSHIYPRGGDLLWKIAVSNDNRQREAIQPERIDVSDDALRGGKILWPLTQVSEIIEIEDPLTGAPLMFVTSDSSKDYAGPNRSYVDFDILESAVGLVIRPKVGDLQVQKTARGVMISRPGGLILSPENLLKLATRSDSSDITNAGFEGRRIYDFEKWQMGGLNALNENKTVILAGLRGLTPGGRVEELINLAKMQLANGRGAEALGFLRFALDEMPSLQSNPKFIALRGASKAFDWRTEEAFEDLSDPLLGPYEEIQYWRAFVLADLGDWQQAINVMPQDLSILNVYPPEVRNRLTPVLAEISLRAGRLDQAETLFKISEFSEDSLNMSHAATLQYLRGEAARQRGDIEKTIALWEPLAEGRDPLFRAKAGLALTRLLSEKKDLSDEDAIDRLERLRYAWRGDSLEGQINYWLGRTYVDAGEALKGLRLLRDSIVYTENEAVSDAIAKEMRLVFAEFFKGPQLTQASPVDAAELYDQFQELTPAGADGDLIIAALAERMVQANMFSRADKLMSHQLDHRLRGEEALKAAVRLSAIRLLSKRADYAIQSLDKAQGLLQSIPPEQLDNNYSRDIALLRARALSELGRADQALALLTTLPAGPDVYRLKADISWASGFWDDAAESLNQVIAEENISFTRPLSEKQAGLILQRAIALNLASDRIALANMRQKFNDSMQQTEQSRLFDVVTRARQNVGLADRETLLSLTSEVDLFGEFLESYRAINTPSN